MLSFKRCSPGPSWHWFHVDLILWPRYVSVAHRWAFLVVWAYENENLDWQNHRNIIFHRKKVFKISWRFTDTLLLTARLLQSMICFSLHSVMRTLCYGIKEIPLAMPKAILQNDWKPCHPCSLLLWPVSRSFSLSEALQLQGTVEMICSVSLLTSSSAEVINHHWVPGIMSWQTD